MAPSTELKGGCCDSATTKHNGHFASKNDFQMEIKNDNNNEVSYP